MRSGQLAAACGVHQETLRYYERRGLLAAPPRDRSGYRDFPDQAVQRIRSIKQAQGLGLSLAEISDLLEANPAGVISCGDLASRIEPKLAEIDAKIADLQALQVHLQNLLCSCCRSGDPHRPCEQTSAWPLSITAVNSVGLELSRPARHDLAPAIRSPHGEAAIAAR